MSNTTINFCGNIMLKSVEMHLIPKKIFFLKVHLFFSLGSEFILVFKLVLLRL